MSILYESENRNLTKTKLFVRGLACALAASAVVAAGIARSQGAFEPVVRVTALMSDIGDGLPTKSDVKYRGVLVGMVTAVEPGIGGGPLRVRIALKPEQAPGIPDTVTARVVPSNLFAIPSIQFVDNGASAALVSGSEIREDRGQATVQLQTSLTALTKIATAVGRSPSDPTVGILETVQRATSGRGDDALRAGAQLERLVHAYSALTEPNGDPSTLAALAAALDGLRVSSPDLLAAVHQAVVPMRTVAQQRERFGALVTGGLTTTETVGASMTRRTDTILGLTADMGPVLEVLGAGSQNFTQMTTSQRRLAEKVSEVLWNPETQSATAKVIVELTPHKQYTREDCPRYGALAGPSCVTGPPGPGVLGAADTAPPAPATPAADTGALAPAGGAPERTRIAAILGRPADAASILLIGPVIRGNDVRVTPVAADEQPAGEPR